MDIVSARTRRYVPVCLLAGWLFAGPPVPRARATGFPPLPSFATPVADPFGLTNAGGSAMPTWADLDGDGDLDGLVGTQQGRFKLFGNSGTAENPSFAAPSAQPFGLADAGDHAAPALGDLDGDGDLDVLAGNYAGQLLFFRNTGTATSPAFGAASTDPFGLADVGPRAAPALADIDGDGDLDVLVGDDPGDLILFANTGSATSPAFAAPLVDPLGLGAAGAFDATPDLVDLDGDGDLDVLAADFAGDLLFFSNTGGVTSPAFAPPSVDPFGLGSTGNHAAPFVVDLDGDGDRDALVGRDDGSIVLFLNTQSSAPRPLFSFPSLNPFGLSNLSFFASPDFVDIDDDGDLDAFVGAWNGEVYFFRNTGGPTSPVFAAPTKDPFGLAHGASVDQPIFTDIDGDGDLDEFVGTSRGTYFARNTGTATSPAFGPATHGVFGLTGVPNANLVVFADLDGDGDLDAFEATHDVGLYFARNTGTATSPAFEAPVHDPFGIQDSGPGEHPAIADLEGDGDFDLMIGTESGATLLLENTGTATSPAFLPASQRLGLVDVGTYAAPALADPDGDGDMDLFIGNNLGNVMLFRSGIRQLLLEDDFESGGTSNWGRTSS